MTTDVAESPPLDLMSDVPPETSVKVVEPSVPFAWSNSTVFKSELYSLVVGVNPAVKRADALLTLTSSICPLNASTGDAAKLEPIIKGLVTS